MELKGIRKARWKMLRHLGSVSFLSTTGRGLLTTFRADLNVEEHDVCSEKALHLIRADAIGSTARLGAPRLGFRLCPSQAFEADVRLEDPSGSRGSVDRREELYLGS